LALNKIEHFSKASNTALFYPDLRFSRVFGLNQPDFIEKLRYMNYTVLTIINFLLVIV